MTKVQPITFKANPRVTFNNVPDVIKNNSKNFEKIAKENHVKFSIDKSGDSKYLPNHDAFIVIAHKTPVTTFPTHYGTSCILTDKKINNKTLLEKVTESVQKAVDKVASKNETNKAEKKISFFQKVLNLFKKK